MREWDGTYAMPDGLGWYLARRKLVRVAESLGMTADELGRRNAGDVERLMVIHDAWESRPRG